MSEENNADLEGENWVPVPDEPFNKTFLISNMGRIKNKNSNYIKPLTKNNSTGFLSIRLDMGKAVKKQTYQMHTLVAKMFIGDKINENDCVVHKDGDRANNRISNLFYGTIGDAMMIHAHINKRKDINIVKISKDELKKIVSATNR